MVGYVETKFQYVRLHKTVHLTNGKKVLSVGIFITYVPLSTSLLHFQLVLRVRRTITSSTEPEHFRSVSGFFWCVASGV